MSTTKVSLAMQTDITLGTAVAATSGTAIDFTGIPAGTKRIAVNFVGVSTDGISGVIAQLGDSGGIETTGYLGSAVTTFASSIATLNTITTGMNVEIDCGAGTIRHGVITLNLVDASTFTWASKATMGRSGTTQSTLAGASKSLSAELTQIRVTMINGSDAFDAGKINIQYE
jgi:hypothetical protein